MNRRTEIGLWIALVALSVAAGIAIAGVPELGAAEDAAPPPPVEETTTTSTTVTSDVEETTTTSTVPAPPAPRANADTPVLVANGTSVPGAAAAVADRLQGEGHPVTGAITVGASPTSQIWFVPGWDVEARDLADRLGLAADAAAPAPQPTPFDLAGATIVVVLGPDLAG